MMRSRRFLPICFGLILLAACSAAAQVSAPPFIVGEVHAAGSHRYTEEQIAATSGLKAGDPVDQRALQGIADRLARLGVFSRVNFHFAAKDRRATVNFEVQDAPGVPVMFENFPWFSDEELSNEIRRAVPLFDGAAPQGGELLDAITTALSAKLAARGIKANVQHTLVAEPSGDAMVMQFRQDGPTFTIASAAFGDSAAQNSEKLKDRLSDLVGKNFSRFAIELFENEQVRPIYLSAGQIGVKFGAPAVEIRNAAGQENLVDVRIPIVPGPAYHLAGISWNGNTVLTTAELSKIVSVKPGDLADGMHLEADWQQIELEYGHRGYLDAKAMAEPEFDPPKASVAYKVTIVEGPQYHMGQLVITGLSVDAERDLRNSWRLAPGQVLDQTYLDQILAKLEMPSVAIFGELPVHYEKMGHLLRTDPKTHVTDVLIDFQ
jgi:outer membrane protein insertion porin family